MGPVDLGPFDLGFGIWDLGLVCGFRFSVFGFGFLVLGLVSVLISAFKFQISNLKFQTLLGFDSRYFFAFEFSAVFDSAKLSLNSLQNFATSFVSVLLSSKFFFT